MTVKKTKQPGRAPYQSSLRARHKEQTAQHILVAVATALRRMDLSAVSIAEVARIAEVTEQTIYRHYATREDLLHSFVKWHLKQTIGAPNIVIPKTIADILAWLGPRYKSWEEDHRIVSETYLSPLGRELRKPLYEFAFSTIVKLIDEEIPNLTETSLQSLATALLTLMSAENFLFLKYNLGYGPKKVHTCVVDAINLMLDGARLVGASEECISKTHSGR